ncbi:MAG: 50S ribosomal protein L35 [Chloroflexi bacterium]|nr:50S ribosomal protein L35 [Chloroflexota bacterium]
MPKLKTHRGAKARFRVTRTGKVLRMKGGSSHLRKNKPKRVRRQYNSKLLLNSRDHTRVSRLLPTGTPS